MDAESLIVEKNNDPYDILENHESVSSTLNRVLQKAMARNKMEASVRRETVNELPSHNFDAVNIKNDPMCSARKEKKYSIEVLKLNKESSRNLRRRLTRNDVEQIAELMLHSKLEIRDLYAPLDVKKQIAKVVLKRLLEEDRKIETASKLFRIWTTIKDSWLKLQNMCDLWHDAIKKIHGNYGSEIVIYFTFLRYLVLMNILNIVIIFMFIVGPVIFKNILDGGDHIEYEVLGKSGNVSFGLQDLLSGSGSLENTLLYYSGYKNGSFFGFFGTKMQFDLPVSYMLSNISLFIVNLIFISYSICVQFYHGGTIRSYLKSPFCNEVFNAWDFSTLTEKAALTKHQKICASIKELLNMEKTSDGFRNGHTNLEITQVVLLYTLMLSLTVLIMCILYDQLNRFVILERIGLFHKLSIAIYASFSVLALHHLVRFLTHNEKFLSERIKIYFVAFRTLAFRLGILFVLLYLWLPAAHVGVIANERLNCFESSEGKELYRISIINFIFDTLGLLCFFGILWMFVNFFRLHRAFKNFLPEFNVAFHITDLIFYQTLIWAGTFYVPLLPVVIILILILNFYIMKLSLSWCYMPSKQRFSCQTSNIFFLSLLLISYIFCLCNAAYKILFIRPSTTCGPFKHLKFAYDRVILWAQSLMKSETALGSFMTFIQSPGLSITLILSFIISIHFTRVHCLAYKRTVDFLEHELEEEEEFKSILLKIYEDKKKRPA